MNLKTATHRTHSVIVLVTTAVALLTAAQHSRADESALPSMEDRIEMAYWARDLRSMEAARAELLAQAGSENAAERPRLAYLAAYARFRQALAAANDTDAARGYIDDCIRELKPLADAAPTQAETRALLGSCYGISTRYHRLGMASRGLSAQREISAARKLAPDNPWVILQDGMADFATPSLFGGDRDLAIAKLERASELFGAEAQAGVRRAAWAEAETWQQLSQMYGAVGRQAEAASAAARSRALATTLATPAERLAAL